MTERPGAVTYLGQPMTLLGEEVAVGAVAPDFVATNPQLAPVSLSDFAGRVVLIGSLPSIDTPVCDAQLRRFNEEAAAMDDDVVVLTVSFDLPFAFVRWCAASGVENVVGLSDHRGHHDFGVKYGLIMKGIDLLARSVIVVDRAGLVVHNELVREVSEPPDYSAAFVAVRTALSSLPA